MSTSIQTATKKPEATLSERAICTAEQLANLRKAVARLADMACDLDTLKNCLPHPELREALSDVVDDMHAAAEYFDRLHGFGLYAAPDGVAADDGVTLGEAS